MIFRRMALVLAICLLLCGCTATDLAMNEAIEFRSALVQSGQCSYTAKICADFGETVEEFTLSCSSLADGTTELTILEPQTLAGLTATVTNAGGTVTYDGMAVAFGLLADGALAPAAAPALTVACWSSEYIAYAETLDSGIRVTYEKGYDAAAIQVDTWFENSLPIYAEVCYNGERVVQMTFSDFQWT